MTTISKTILPNKTEKLFKNSSSFFFFFVKAAEVSYNISDRLPTDW